MPTLKSKIFGRKSFRKTTSDKKLSDAFSGISDKKLSDKHDIKSKHDTKISVKINRDSIKNINLGTW